MKTKPCMLKHLTFALFFGVLSANALAQAAERSRAELTSIVIGGISLDTPARAAFEHLVAQGFDPGIPGFEAWDKPLLEFIRGSVDSTDGFNQVQLAREGDRLTNIVLHIQRPRGARFSITGEVDRARSHFGIPADSKACIEGPTMGSCSVTSPGGEMNYHQTTMAVSRTEEVTINQGVVSEN